MSGTKTEFVAHLEPGIPHSRTARKQTPVATGLLGYFPDACAEVAKTSFVSNEQHNPGEPMHWARGKSQDHADAAVRHVMDFIKARALGRPVRDKDGNHFLAQAAWRCLALCQLDVEREQAELAGKTENT